MRDTTLPKSGATKARPREERLTDLIKFVARTQIEGLSTAQVIDEMAALHGGSRSLRNAFARSLGRNIGAKHFRETLVLNPIGQPLDHKIRGLVFVTTNLPEVRHIFETSWKNQSLDEVRLHERIIEHTIRKTLEWGSRSDDARAVHVLVYEAMILHAADFGLMFSVSAMNTAIMQRWVREVVALVPCVRDTRTVPISYARSCFAPLDYRRDPERWGEPTCEVKPPEGDLTGKPWDTGSQSAPPDTAAPADVGSATKSGKHAKRRTKGILKREHP